MMAGSFVPCSGAEHPRQVQAHCVAEIACVSARRYDNPFTAITLDAVVTRPDGTRVRVPAFWAGADQWRFRYASGQLGVHTFALACSDPANTGLHGVTGSIEVVRYRGRNPLIRHGPLGVADDRRHFAHADGTGFLWLGDTWWKGLCRRLTWTGFRTLTADRRAKGFNVVQIVCGPYPDEEMLQPGWAGKGGMPYLRRDLGVVNPAYFEHADRRIRHLVDAGIVPAIVGGWGRPQHGGRSTIAQVGLKGYRRHWRHLIARYGAFPVVWIVGGEATDAQGPWARLARYVKRTDPYGRLLTYHAPGHPRQAIADNAVFDFDMVAIGHDGFKTAAKTLELIGACRSARPVRPVVCGEACYEGHMQTNFQDVQRHLFWSFLLSGAAGHTYGAAGVWHASIEGDPGICPVYDLTTWREGMYYPGSRQLGLGKRLLTAYPWSRFVPHSEWVEQGCFAAGIPGEVRIVYMPRRGVYDWRGPAVHGLDPHVDWRVYCFDPATGRTFDQGTLRARARPGGKAAGGVTFQRDVPSPQDWVLVFERIRP